MTMRKPTKRAVSLAVRSPSAGDRVLMVRRPQDDADFAGMWGLPAATCGPDESLEAAAGRVGTEKLGTALVLGAAIATGSQSRPGYELTMTLFEARLAGDRPRLPETAGPGTAVTLYTDWRWGDLEDLRPSADRGSLCSLLLLGSMPSGTDGGA